MKRGLPVAGERATECGVDVADRLQRDHLWMIQLAVDDASGLKAENDLEGLAATSCPGRVGTRSRGKSVRLAVSGSAQ